MKKKLAKTITAVILLTLTICTIASAAILRAPRTTCPRCGSYSGSAVWGATSYHITTCSNCRTSYEQFHYDYNNNGFCDACGE